MFVSPPFFENPIQSDRVFCFIPFDKLRVVCVVIRYSIVRLTLVLVRETIQAVFGVLFWFCVVFLFPKADFLNDI